MDLPQALASRQLPRRKEATCPHGRLEEDALGRQYVVCGVMVEDQKRADSILEGAPVGEVVRAHEDPSMFYFFCTGEADPGDPDDVPNLEPGGPGDPAGMSYTRCPIFAAAREWRSEQRRLFGAPVRADEPDPEVMDLVERGVIQVGPEALEPEEELWLTSPAG